MQHLLSVFFRVLTTLWYKWII